MTDKEKKAKQFKALMNQVNKLYPLGRKVYVRTSEGTAIATVIKVNPSKFLVACSVVLSVDYCRQQTLMFTASDIIDEPKEDTPVDAYQDLDLEQTEGEPTAEEINQAEGVKFCSFMAAVEANTKDSKDVPVKEEKLTEAQKAAYYEQALISQKYYELERSKNTHI